MTDKNIIEYFNECSINAGFSDWEDLKGQTDEWEIIYLIPFINSLIEREKEKSYNEALKDRAEQIEK